MGQQWPITQCLLGGVMDALALGKEVTLRVLDYTKCGAYKYQHTEEISYTRALPQMVVAKSKIL